MMKLDRKTFSTGVGACETDGADHTPVPSARRRPFAPVQAHARHVRENGIFEPFIYKNEHFAKTGSGQT